jgi:uncharacterized protein YjbI with pentapeptide repeats
MVRICGATATNPKHSTPLGADLSEANLGEANLSEANLSEADLGETGLPARAAARHRSTRLL